MWTLMLTLAATSWAAQSRVWAVLSTTQPVAVVLPVSRVQLRPLGARWSVLHTTFDSDGSVVVCATDQPMVSPALAVEPAVPLTSAVLVKSKVAQLTRSEERRVGEECESSLAVGKWAR